MTRDPLERKLEALRERPILPHEPGSRPRGRLLIIGGREDREGRKLILKRLASHVGTGKIAVITAASEEPDELFAIYERAFRSLGVPHVHHLRIESRADGDTVRSMRALDDAEAVFFTGGDQLRITTLVGDTPTYSRVCEIFRDGGTIAGTSAGAAVMSETMVVGGNGERSYRIGGDLHLAPGFALAKDMMVDQHFAERGRIGRLLGVVAQNPRIVGIGIDEDTAIEVVPGREFQVFGSGGVTVIDGRDVTHTNVAEEDTHRTLSIFGVRVHVLSQGDSFDLRTRTPESLPAREIEKLLGVSSGEGEREPAR